MICLLSPLGLEVRFASGLSLFILHRVSLHGGFKEVFAFRDCFLAMGCVERIGECGTEGGQRECRGGVKGTRARQTQCAMQGRWLCLHNICLEDGLRGELGLGIVLEVACSHLRPWAIVFPVAFVLQMLSFPGSFVFDEKDGERSRKQNVINKTCSSKPKHNDVNGVQSATLPLANPRSHRGGGQTAGSSGSCGFADREKTKFEAFFVARCRVGG